MNKEYRPIKLDAIKFIAPMSYDECIKKLAKMERERRKERVEKLKSMPIRNSYDELGDLIFIIVSIFLIATLLMGFTVGICVTIILALLLIAMDVGSTKSEIKVRQEEYKAATSLPDDKLFETKFVYHYLEGYKKCVDTFFKLKNNKIIAMRQTDFNSYEFKCADENGDVFEVELNYDSFSRNVKMTEDLSIELTDTFEIVVREKEYCE